MFTPITIASWNMDGISFLKTEPEKRGRLKALIRRQLNDECVLKHRPDFIAVQEIVINEQDGKVKRLLIKTGQPPLYEIAVSDHYLVVAKFPFGVS